MYDSPTITALASGQLVLRDYLYVRGKTFAGATINFGFWVGVDDVAVNVVSARDGTTESRNFIGGGTLLDVPAIYDAIGIEARGVAFGLSQIHAQTQAMLRANNVRVAVVELHRGVLSPATWALVSTPFARFLGRVDGAEIETAAAGAEGGITLNAMSGAIDLTRANPAMSSDEQQRLRSGDRFRKHSDSAGQVDVWWGQAKGAAD